MRENLLMVHGTERTFILNLEDAEGDLPVLTNATCELIVKDQFRKAATIDESTGDAAITIEPADTTDLGNYRISVPYNVRVTEQDGTIKITQNGRFTILPAVEEPE
jgi:hypothetical protein